MKNFKKEHIVAELSNGIETVKYEDKGLYYAVAKVTKEEENKVQEGRTNFFKNATDYAVDYATERFNSEDDVTTVNMSYPMGENTKNTYNVTVIKSVESRNPKTGETIHKPKIITEFNDSSALSKKQITDLRNRIVTALLKDEEEE